MIMAVGTQARLLFFFGKALFIVQEAPYAALDPVHPQMPTRLALAFISSASAAESSEDGRFGLA